jgi:tetratricopeptide (TPR) repeat protein
MCRQRGLLAEGEEAGRRAVALAPNFAAAWSNLGIVLQEMLKLDESRLCLERALALEPNNPETLNNFANTLKRLGLAAEAEKHWHAALALNPDYAEAYSNLSNLLNDEGAYDRAESMARRAIELNPGLADAYINLAAACTVRHRHADALQVLDALLAFAPAHARALAARALTLKELDRLDEALEAANCAALQAPETPEAHNAVGQVFQSMGEFDAALAAYDRAAGLPGPAQMDAIANRGALYMEFGRMDDAAKAFEEAAKAFPNAPGILFSQTDLRRFELGDPLIGQIQALLAREGASLADRATPHFGLGKAFLDIGDSEQAFRHYGEGNRLKRSTFSYDLEANERWMADIAEVFSSALLAAKADMGASSDLPVFVVGMPRSGTTLVEQILASHPMVNGAGELKRLQTLVDRLENFPGAVASLTAAQLKPFGEAYLTFIKPMAGDRRHVVDKMPSNFLHAGFIRLALPDARIVHCRRDPIDTCLSCYTKLFAGEQPFAYNQTELGRFHRAYQKLMMHWRAILPGSHFLEVDYEAVVDNVEHEARRMLDFLNLPWNERVLRFHETERPVRTASVNQVRQPIYRTSAGRWRKHAAHLRPLVAALDFPLE